VAQVTVNGVRLVYETRGEGVPMLLVCGTGQPAETWSMFGTTANFVDAGYQVTAFDNRGIPPSDVPEPPYAVSEMAEDTIGLMEHLGAAPFVVMGASLGGVITQTVALRRPDLVRAAIFLVGCGNMSRYSAAYIGLQVKIVRAGIELDDDERALTVFQAVAPSTAWGNDEAFEAVRSMASLFVAGDPRGELGQYEADLGWSREDHLTELAGLRVPALAIACEYDFIFPPKLVRKAVEQMPDGEFVEIPGATHVAMDKGAELNAAISDFLQRRAPATARLACAD